MTTPSLTLGDHWDAFIEREIASGRYTSASDIVRAALRELEEREQRLGALRTHLADGAGQAARGEFVDTPTPAQIVQDAKLRARK